MAHSSQRPLTLSFRATMAATRTTSWRKSSKNTLCKLWIPPITRLNNCFFQRKAPREPQKLPLRHATSLQRRRSPHISPKTLSLRLLTSIKTMRAISGMRNPSSSSVSFSVSSTSSKRLPAASQMSTQSLTRCLIRSGQRPRLSVAFEHSEVYLR